MSTIIGFVKKVFDAVASFCKKVIQWSKEKIEKIKNKTSDD
tara:strand:- start:14316 stop:14438 length:123 start_codon:yes stop_codon:yes gene_type:complete